MNPYNNVNYLKEDEPDGIQKSENWATAKGLQQVDGLETSTYLDEIAERHIKGDISSYEAARLIDTYYEVQADRNVIEEHREADIVAARINILIGEIAFNLAPEELRNIHFRLFDGVYAHAGHFRERNIMKHEWVLDGDTVTYGDFRNIDDILERCVRKERLTRFSSLDDEQILSHLADFVSSLWQAHPFEEGNTRTVAVFAIKYFRLLGFDVDNTVFEKNSWYFRNALVRANYTNIRKKVDADKSYLEEFLSCILYGNPKKEFLNRNLHILAGRTNLDKVPQGNALDNSILQNIASNPYITRKALAGKHGVSEKTIERHLKQLGILFEGASKTGHWVLPE